MSHRKKHSTSNGEAGTVLGLFRTQPQAERAIRDLKDAGFRDDQIGVLMQDPQRQQQLADDTGTEAGGAAATGAISGGVVGGVLGLLAGVGALAIPGVGPIIAGGALASTLAGAGIGAAAGGLLGALVGMGVPEEEARYYERGVQEGGILLTVEAGPRSAEARRILTGAEAQLAPEHLELREKETERLRNAVRREEARVEEMMDARSHDRDPTERESWRGNERRYRRDRSYMGPERRVANV